METCVAVVCVTVLGLGSGSVSRAASEAPAQSIRIDVRGAIAHVSVSRTLSWPPRSPNRSGVAKLADQTTDAVLDVALPVHAQLLDVAVGNGRTSSATRPIALAKGRDAYLESLHAIGVAASEIAFEDEASVRIRIAVPETYTSKTIVLNYSFSVLLELSGKQARLAFPAAAELSPPATRVEVQVLAGSGMTEIAIDGASHLTRGSASPSAVEIVSTRSPWVVVMGPIRGIGSVGDQPRLVAMTSTASPRGRPSLWAYALAAGPGPQPSVLPERVLFLVDRSRSVGPGGLEAERDLARRVLEAMPPSTRFDALFFDRAQKRLFPLARTATREAIAALEDEMVPARMSNGTDLTGALHAAGDLLRRDAADFAPRCLLVLLTDGAVGAVPARFATLPALLGGPPGVALQVASLSVRPNDDVSVSPPERRILRMLAATAPLGGAERTLRVAEVADAVPALMETLRGGGDVFGISFGDGSAGDVVKATDVLESGGSIAGAIAWPGPTPVGKAISRTLSYHGQSSPLPLRPVAVDAGWIEPLVTARPPDARILIGPGISALVEPVVRPAATPTRAAEIEANPPGFMERSVVRDALSLAFTPRARACYLNRTARTAAERDLAGRVRLALDLVRGEVVGVRIVASTLAHVAIETCLREAAYALEVPRAYRNDEAVTAVLNLVFRPRTPDRAATGPQNPGLDREIDTLVDAALKDGRAAEDVAEKPPAAAATQPAVPAATDVRPAVPGPDAAAPSH